MKYLLLVLLLFSCTKNNQLKSIHSFEDSSISKEYLTIDDDNKNVVSLINVKTAMGFETRKNIYLKNESSETLNVVDLSQIVLPSYIRISQDSCSSKFLKVGAYCFIEFTYTYDELRTDEDLEYNIVSGSNEYKLFISVSLDDSYLNDLNELHISKPVINMGRTLELNSSSSSFYLLNKGFFRSLSTQLQYDSNILSVSSSCPAFLRPKRACLINVKHTYNNLGNYSTEISFSGMSNSLLVTGHDDSPENLDIPRIVISETKIGIFKSRFYFFNQHNFSTSLSDLDLSGLNVIKNTCLNENLGANRSCYVDVEKTSDNYRITSDMNRFLKVYDQNVETIFNEDLNLYTKNLESEFTFDSGSSNFKIILENHNNLAQTLEINVPERLAYLSNFSVFNDCGNGLAPYRICSLNYSYDSDFFPAGFTHDEMIDISGVPHNIKIVGTSPCSEPATILNNEKTDCVYRYGTFDSPDSFFGQVRFK